MKIRYFQVFIIIFVTVLLSCAKHKNNTPLIVSAEYIRLDSLILAQKTPADIQALLLKNPKPTQAYFGIQENDLPAFCENMSQIVQNSGFQDFYKTSINSTNGIKTDSLKNALNEAFANIKTYDSSFVVPKVYFAFTGFTGADLLVSDSSIVIGLDYFVGKKASFRPQLYDYQLYKYEPAFIVPQIVNQVAQRYAKTDIADKTLLADMLFYGKCFEFTHTMLPNTADSLIIGIANNRLIQTQNSQNVVWAHFIEQKLLFEKSDFKNQNTLTSAQTLWK